MGLERLMAREVLSGLVVLVSAVAIACSPARMQVPADVASRSDLLAVTERGAWSGALVNESFKLGPYAVKNVDRKWDVTTGFIAGNLSHSNTEGGYAFRFEGAGANENGHCASGTKDTDVKFRTGKLEFQFSKLACSCDEAGRQAIVVVESAGGKYAGTLTTPAGTYRVTSVHDLVGGAHSEDPVGYRIDGRSGVGAAEVIHPGRVWLDQALSSEERAHVACLVAGLMLYVPKDQL
jgi:hypothetical protein